MEDTVLIEVTNLVRQQSSLVDNLTSISKALKQFLDALIHVSNNSPEKINVDNFLVTRKAIQARLKDQDLGSSDSLVSRRLKELVEYEVAEYKTHMQTGRKRLNHYKIKDLSTLAALAPKKPPSKPKSRRTREIVRLQKDAFKNSDNSLLLSDHKNISVHFHERVFNGILDQAMRLSGKDSRKEIVVQSTVGGGPLEITATCSSAEDSGIAILTDQRAMRSIISYCKKEIARHKQILINKNGNDNYDPRQIPNLFHLDIHDLCELMGMSCVNTNLDQIVPMMQRLADTKFKVDATENRWFKENFSMFSGVDMDLPPSDTFEFRFLTNFDVAHENSTITELYGVEVGELRPRFYTFSLEQRLFLSLILDSSDNLFLSHRELSSERSGIIQRFYNWARAFISGRPKSGLDHHWYSIHEMHEYLTPSARYDNFRAYFFRALKKFAVNDWEKDGKSLIYGYYVFYERRNGDDMFRFERDLHDHIVGNNSRHNILIRQQLLEGISGNESAAEAE